MVNHSLSMIDIIVKAIELQIPWLPVLRVLFTPLGGGQLLILFHRLFQMTFLVDLNIDSPEFLVVTFRFSLV